MSTYQNQGSSGRRRLSRPESLKQEPLDGGKEFENQGRRGRRRPTEA